MKQLSSLTKIMFCIVAILLIITVVLGIATAVKDGKENGGSGTTPAPVTSVPNQDEPTKIPGPTNEPDATTPPDATPTPVTSTPDPTETPVPTKAAAKHVIAIDPGQQKATMKEKEPVGPGSTTMVDKMTYGATSITTETREHVWTLMLAEQLKKELESRGYEVILTRDSYDVQISNAERALAVAETKAEVYIGLQLDASSKEEIKGIYTQVPSKKNPYISELYNDCMILGKLIHQKLIENTEAQDRGMREDDSVPAINYSKIPVAVFQLGFMSNKEEDTNLWKDEYQNKMVQAICDGIDEYFND